MQKKFVRAGTCAADNRFQIGGGVDDSVLCLSFAQQKYEKQNKGKKNLSRKVLKIETFGNGDFPAATTYELIGA
jgi:hypothetical protein